jgi:hypothetical protein
VQTLVKAHSGSMEDPASTDATPVTKISRLACPRLTEALGLTMRDMGPDSGEEPETSTPFDTALFGADTGSGTKPTLTMNADGLRDVQQLCPLRPVAIRGAELSVLLSFQGSLLQRTGTSRLNTRTMPLTACIAARTPLCSRTVIRSGIADRQRFAASGSGCPFCAQGCHCGRHG